MTGAGIDYSGPSGTCNRDLETGIRYGIIPLGRLNDSAMDAFEGEYDLSCPHCGADLADDFEGPNACPECAREIADGEQYADEPSHWALVEDGYEGFLDSSNDVWITSSPYYTRAAFCSPCAPGACYLTDPREDGARAYCLGPDWFDGPAPYPIYRVADDGRED